jgi:hypothetical protein
MTSVKEYFETVNCKDCLLRDICNKKADPNSICANVDNDELNEDIEDFVGIEKGHNDLKNEIIEEELAINKAKITKRNEIEAKKRNTRSKNYVINKERAAQRKAERIKKEYESFKKIFSESKDLANKIINS